MALVSTLPVKGRAPKTGYSRDKFGAGWQTHAGCSTREQVLRRDLSEVVVRAGTNGCTVVGGKLADPYTGKTVKVTAQTVRELDTEHVVSLSDAWQKGAQQWSMARRATFANDLVELIVTGQSINAAKGDGDAATWLPPNKPYRCAYIARQATVKAKYGLWVTTAERDSMVKVLSACPKQAPLNATAARKVTDPTPTIVQPVKAKPKHAPPKPQPAPKPKSASSVHSGAFCADHGGLGVTSSGTRMVCSATATDARYRWRRR